MKNRHNALTDRTHAEANVEQIPSGYEKEGVPAIQSFRHVSGHIIQYYEDGIEPNEQRRNDQESVTDILIEIFLRHLTDICRIHHLQA